MSDKKLNKFEKEKKVLELHKEGLTIREISRIVHMPFHDIVKLIKKYKEDTDQNKKLKEKIAIEALTLLIKESSLLK